MSSSEYTITALNLILLNCTNSRTFSQRVYGDCIPPGWSKMKEYWNY